MTIGTINGREVEAYQIMVGQHQLGCNWIIKYWLKQDPQTHYVEAAGGTVIDSKVTSIDMAFGLAENAWAKLLDVKMTENEPTKITVGEGEGNDASNVPESAQE